MRSLPLSTFLLPLVEILPWSVLLLSLEFSSQFLSCFVESTLTVAHVAYRSPIVTEAVYYALQVIRLKQEEHIASERSLLALIDHPFVVKLCVIRSICTEYNLSGRGPCNANDACRGSASHRASRDSSQTGVILGIGLSRTPRSCIGRG